MLRRTILRRTATVVSAAILIAALAPTTLAARPKTTPDEPPPSALYCDHLPAYLPAAYTCIGEETIELIAPTREHSGTISPQLNPGVIDK